MHTIFTLSHPWCPHDINYTLPCSIPTKGGNGYCHSAWEFYSIIVVRTDYTEQMDDGSVQIIHFQVFIGTCRLFYFAFYGWTSNIDALTKLQYALWNKGYKIHLPCLQCLLTHCYCTIQWGQPWVTRSAHTPRLAILGSMLSRFMSPHPILERLTTTFVWLCWCKLHCLGDWIFTLHWSANTNSYSCPLFWVTKCHVECGNNLLH